MSLLLLIFAYCSAYAQVRTVTGTVTSDDSGPLPGVNIVIQGTTQGAVTDVDGWLWYNIGDDRWIRQTQVSLLDVDSPPAEVGPGEYWVEVDLYEQTFAAYEGPRMVYAGLISSGLNRWPTEEGIFQVWSRHLQTAENSC